MRGEAGKDDRGGEEGDCGGEGSAKESVAVEFY